MLYLKNATKLHDMFYDENLHLYTFIFFESFIIIINFCHLLLITLIYAKNYNRLY